MDKNKKLIMVVERDVLFGNGHFIGFKHKDDLDYMQIILSNYSWRERGPVEDDTRLKQPTGYTVIINPTLKEIFVYQRSTKDKEYIEKRLQGKYSWGVGGHVEKIDEESENPITTSIMRELKEEVEMNNNFRDPELFGYINLEHDVHAVHFGLLYIVKTESRIVKPKDPEIKTGGLRPIRELEKICSSGKFQVEDWSRVALPYISLLSR
ncbi:hypothetical protein HYX17_02670 [Candidatus Woesearchaeota archaeon]|nr:hypothetical protein [Candidatus Woesearchaeota archaeon]